MRRGRPRSDAGSVTAEFAAIVPAVFLVLAFCLAALQVAGTQARLQDAASGAARSLGRGEDAGPLVAATGISGVSLARHSDGRLVCVSLSAQASGLAGTLAGVTLHSSSCALDEGRG